MAGISRLAREARTRAVVRTGEKQSASNSLPSSSLPSYGRKRMRLRLVKLPNTPRCPFDGQAENCSAASPKEISPATMRARSASASASASGDGGSRMCEACGEKKTGLGARRIREIVP